LVKIIDNEIDRLDNLVEDFICYSRPIRLRLEPVSMNTVVKETLAVFSLNPQVGHKVQLERELMTPVPDFHMDARRVKQILLNVLNNALEAMPNGGTIRVATVYRVDDNEMDVRISDTGGGIPKDILPQIFEPFFSTKDRGMGLGLNIVHNMMKAHRGYFSVGSTPGSGTEVLLSFPVRRTISEDERNALNLQSGTMATHWQ